MVKSECFMLGLIESRVKEKCARAKERVLTKCSKLEETARPVHSDSSQYLGDQDIPFLQV